MDVMYCNFAQYEDEDLSEWFNAGTWDEEDADGAVRRFASYAQDNMDMWDHKDEWHGDYAIVVKSESGFRKVFNVNHEYEPVFHVYEDRSV